MVYEDIRVPKEKFLVDFFSSPKPATSVKPERAFDEVLKSVQIKIEKKQLEPLMSGPPHKADAEIDSMGSRDAFIALKESINVLKDIIG
ncbi:MAG: hypothetical protein AABZ57_03490 [Candidatus Margulisiibacteriota bacterium]